jgi:branched-chain amino acid transport system substrate-binding protein
LTPHSTPAEVRAAMYKIKGTTLGGMSAPLTPVPGKPVFTPCYYTMTIKNNQLLNLDGGKPTCLSATQANALLAGLSKAS